ncbi:MAG: hypothetical protein U0270_28285 [Labilithrix sp.]
MLDDRCLAGVLLFTFAACARPAAPATATVPVRAVPRDTEQEAPHLAVIAVGERQSVHLTADGTMLESVPETCIAIHRRVLTVKHDVEDGRYTCHLDYGHGLPPVDQTGAYRGDGLLLVDLASGKSTVVVEKEKRGETENWMVTQTQLASVSGVVGSYLFLREESTVFGCGGAHPFRGVRGLVWDAAAQQPLELVAPADVIARARKQLEGRGLPETEPRLAEAIPRFDEEGRLSIAWRFEKPSTHAESDGEGSSSNLSVVVGSDELPPDLASYREPPPAIRNYLANGGEPIIGYSTL